MTTDLWMLAASVAMTWAFILIAATPGILNNGIGWAFGNRDETPPSQGMPARANRLAANMLENLPLFTALVLIAHVSGKAGSLSALGAQVFFYARVAHGLCYLAGVPGVRTVTWAISCVGMGMVGASLFG